MFMNDKQSKLVRSSTAQSKDLPGQLLNRRSLTTSVDNCLSTSIAGTYIYCTGDKSQFNRCNGSPFVKTQRTCHQSHTSLTRYLNKSSTINNNNNSFFTAFPASKSTGQAIGVKCLKKSKDSSRLTPWKRCPKCSSLLHAREPGNFGGGLVGCKIAQPKTRVYEKNDLQPGLNTPAYCSNIKWERQLQCRARAKTHGRTPVSTELPRGRHLGSDAYIS